MGATTTYPVHVDGHLDPGVSRWLWLVKWWLLSIPHYLVLAFFIGSGLYIATGDRADNAPLMWGSGGLIGLLVFVAGVVLLFTGRYPETIYDLVLGMNRWVLRVAGYASLMTDRYPPFRLDLGGEEPDAYLAMSSGPPECPPECPADGPADRPPDGQPYAEAWAG